jgi:hypothetical protein
MSVELRATTAEGDLALSQEALVPPLPLVQHCLRVPLGARVMRRSLRQPV